MKVIILQNAQAVATYGANLVVQQLKRKPESVLGLATGATPIALYRECIKAHQAGDVSFKLATSFNLDEYLGLSPDHAQSYRFYMHDVFFRHIDIQLKSTFVPQGDAQDPFAACDAYEATIKEHGGIDFQLLGIGRNGHIGFNEPSSSLASRTRVKTLSRETIQDNAHFFSAGEFQPHLSLTMGIGTIMEARHILLIATGESKSAAIQAVVEGPVTASCPASILQMHPKVDVVIDEAAASALKDTEFYKHIEMENQRLRQRNSNNDV